MNCNVCDSKDQIEIAGKTFCANCGAVDSFVDKNNNSQQQTSQVNPSFQIQAVQQNSGNNPMVQQNNNQSIGTQSAQAPAPIQNPTTTTLPQTNIPYQQASAPIPSPGYSQQSTIGNVPVAASNTQLNNSYTQSNQPITNSPQSVNTTNSMFADTQVPTQSNVPSQPNVPPLQKPPAQQTTTENPSPTENIGNEIGQLSKKDDMVFSDAELDQLANEKPAASNVTNPFADITTNYDSPNQKTRPIDNISINNTPKAQIPQNTAGEANTQGPNPQSAPKMTMQKPTPQSVANTLPPNSSSHTASSQDNVQAGIISAQVEKPKKNSKLKKHGSKVASVGLSLAGVILLGVYVWQINYPNLALKVAGSKAGISASLPAYLPNGWKISGDIQANPGSISYKLATAEGDKSVSVNQVRSDWDSQALAENYLAPNADKYTALQAEGLTIYIYNNNQASWVNHGTWYRIEGQDHGLSKDQIIKMATSL
ncbi:MAG: hypothetical protein QG675_239 [Patescibacteria group bacterium]|jgi:hypothetical protein|nr:hypothetical protein [Patescibacteria group bacterium]